MTYPPRVLEALANDQIVVVIPGDLDGDPRTYTRSFQPTASSVPWMFSPDPAQRVALLYWLMRYARDRAIEHGLTV